MSTSTEVAQEGGRAVVVKRGDAPERLQAEEARLRRASHPGVVQVLSSGPVGTGWEVRTVHAGRPLSAMGRVSVHQAAGLLASLCATVADLHQVGIVHGRIDASHVLVGESGRAVLCGFGAATDMRPEDDVAALGTLLASLLGTDEVLEPIPERRWAGPRRWAGWERRALLLLADQATSDPATRRPTARRLASAITEVVPGFTPSTEHPAGADVDPIESLRAGVLVDDGHRAARPSLWIGAVAVAILVVAAGVGMARHDGEDVPDAAPSSSATPSTVVTTDVTDVVVALRASTPVPAEGVAAEGRRYRVGQPGDEVLVDDWDCDGHAAPALLRPSTGEVFVFRRWIERDRISVSPVLTVPGATALVTDGDPGCPSLAVRTRTGDVVPVTEVRR